jgi:hypothetical protein
MGRLNLRDVVDAKTSKELDFTIQQMSERQNIGFGHSI